MAARSFQITLAAAAKRLSDVYNDGVGVVNAANDIPYRQLLFTAEADSYLGSSSAVTSTTYGIKVATAATLPTVLGPYETGPLKLSDLYGAGNGVLHILGIPF